jgi:hypothetical protein
VVVQVAVIVLTFSTFSASEAASLSVSVGFLLVTILYVASTQKMASISAESLRLERSRDDRLRLAALQERLRVASREATRAWFYFAQDKSVLADMDDEPFGSEPLEPTPDEALYRALQAKSAVRETHGEIRRSVSMLKRCGLGNEAADFDEAVNRFNAAVTRYMAIGQRSTRPKDRDALRVWEQESWLERRGDEGLPPWEDVEGGRVHTELTAAITAFSMGIDRYWSKQ